MAKPTIGIVKGPTADEVHGEPLFDKTASLDGKVVFFPDDREGVDRWGQPYKEKMVCGTSWDDACKLYLEESCPGDRNRPLGRPARAAPNEVATCDLQCGICGGGGWIDKGKGGTMAICGWPRNDRMYLSAMDEFGGTMRTDRCTAPPPLAPAAPFPVSYIPVGERYMTKWMPKLAEMNGGGSYPLMAVTMKSALPGTRARDWNPKTVRKPPRTLLRDRIGGYQGQLMVNGLTKDNIIDDAWDQRKYVYDFCAASGVDWMVTPQYSAYPQFQLCMTVYNTRRIFQWYEDCVERGFPKVALDLPPNIHSPWVYDEYIGFVERSKVAYVTLSYQQFRGRGGGIDSRAVYSAKRYHEALPRDVAVILFGTGTMARMMLMAKIFEGRQIVFGTVEAAARAVFFELIPSGSSAPAGMAKDEVFARNVLNMRVQADRVLERARGRPIPEDSVVPPSPTRRASTGSVSKMETRKHSRRRRSRRR